MVRLDPRALEGTSEAIRSAIQRLAALPEAPKVPANVSRKAQAAVAAVIFQAPSRANARNDVSKDACVCVDDGKGSKQMQQNGTSPHLNGNHGSDEYEPELHVLCTTRAMHLSSHPGQASLPGGKCDYGDRDVAHTAFRETCEEIGLAGDALETGECVLLGVLRPFLSKTALLVHPVVFWLPPRTASKVLASLYPSPDEVSALWSYPLRAVLSSEPPRQVKKAGATMEGQCAVQYGEPLMALEDPKKIDRHRPPQYAFRTYSDIPWLLNGTYRLHRFRSTHQHIKGLTADILINVAYHAYQKTSWQGPLYPVFAPLQASWDDCVAYIITRNISGAPRIKGRWGDGESGDSYGSVEKYATLVGQDYETLASDALLQQRDPREDETMTKREGQVTWEMPRKHPAQTNAADQVAT